MRSDGCMSASPETEGAEPAEAPELEVDRLLSGESGIVAGPRARLRARFADFLDDAALATRLVPTRLERAARRAATGSVLVLGLYSADYAGFMERATAELMHSRREVELVL